VTRGFLLLLLAFGALPARGTPPEPLSPWAGIDADIERLAIRGELPLEAVTFRPMDRGELRDALRPAARSPSRRHVESELAGGSPRSGSLIDHCHEQKTLSLLPYARLAPVFAEGGEAAWTDSSRVGIRGIFTHGSSLVVRAGLFAAEVSEGRRFADPLMAGTDLILHEEEMTISARILGARIRAGRDRHRWGPGISGTLLLSDDGEPFDFAEYQVRMGEHLRFLALTGITSTHQRRYLSAHRLTWTPRPDLSLSFSEGARFQSESPPLLYATGIVPYTLVERMDLQDNLADSTREESRNNVLWSLDVCWRPRPGWLLYAEVLADDIGTETGEAPNRGGLQLGGSMAPRWRGWDWTLGAEFTRISNYTYSVYYQSACLCDWEHQGEAVGYALGCDVASLLCRCTVDWSDTWGARTWVRHVAQGEGEIGRPWSPSSTGCGDGADCGEVRAWSLSGVVERRWAGGFEIRCRPHRLARGGIWIEVGRVENGGHDLSDPKWGTRAGCLLSLGGS